MKLFLSIWLLLVSGAISATDVEPFDSEKFAKDYFDAWVATQNAGATKEDLEHYLSFLSEDVGHQHLPYDPDDKRSSDGKRCTP